MMDVAAAMKNADIKINPRPKAWDYIDKLLTTADTAKDPLIVHLCTSFRRTARLAVGEDR